MPARLLIACLLLASAGCGRIVDRAVKSSATYTPWDFFIIDGDDGAPIAGARVSAVADLADDAVGNTNRRGIVRLEVPTGVCEGVYVRKDGYMPSPSQHPEWEKLRGTIVIPLYREPPPRTGLIIPTGFRGAFHVREFQPTIHPSERPTTATPPLARGRREFLSVVDASAVTELKRPPTMMHRGMHLKTYETRQPGGQSSTFQLDDSDIPLFRFSDGTPLRLENPTMPSAGFLIGVRDLLPPPPGGVALYRLGEWYEGVASGTTPHAIYFVGTLAEAKRAQQARAAATLPPATSPTARPRHATKFTPIPLVIPELRRPTTR